MTSDRTKQLADIDKLLVQTKADFEKLSPEMQEQIKDLTKLMAESFVKFIKFGWCGEPESNEDAND